MPRLADPNLGGPSFRHDSFKVRILWVFRPCRLLDSGESLRALLIARYPGTAGMSANES